MAAPNNPISGLLDPLSDYADQQTKMDQARKMLMGKYMLDQNAAASTRRFETLNANIKGFEDRRKDLESHKWNMLNALIDPQGNAFQGQQRSSILKQLGFDENTYQVMLGSLNTDLRAIDRVLQSNYQLRNEAYGFGQSQGVDNVYARGGGAGGGATGAPTGEELLIQSFQQGGAPSAVTRLAGDEDQDGEGFDLSGAVKTAADVGKAMGELGKGYKIWVQDPNNFVNKAFKEGLINPNSSKNYALAVYRKALSLLPEGASEEQIQEFWLAPGLQGRLKEIIEAGRNDKKSFDSLISEHLSDYDKYFKILGGFSDDIGLTDAWRKGNLYIGDQLDKLFPHNPDSEVAPRASASPPAAAPPSATPSAIVPPTPSSASPDLPFHPMVSPPSQAPSPIPSGNLSGTPSPDVFGTGQIPAPDYMSEWQQFHENYIPDLPWDPRAVPADPDSMAGSRSNIEWARRTYERNLQNLFYEGSQMGGAINAAPADANLPYSAPPAEISVVPTYEVFQQRIQGTPGDPGFYGSPMAPAATQQQMSVAQGTPGDPNLQGNVGLDTSVTSPLFQDPMGGGVGQPTMNQQTVPMAPMGGTEGVMSAVDEGAMNPFIAPGQPQGRVGDPYAPPSLDDRVPPASYPSRGFGDSDMDTWYQPAMDIGAPSGDPFDELDVLAAGDVGGPGQMTLTPEEKTASSKREFEELASRFGSFTGETWNDFIDWGMDAAKENPLTIAAIAGAGGTSYFLGSAIRRKAFNDYDKAVDAYNEKRAKGTPARTKIDQVADDVKEKENMKKTKEKDGRSLSAKEQGKLDDARDDLRNKKSLAWKDFMKKQAKRASWIGLGGAVIYGLSTEAFGMDSVDRQIGLALDDNKKAQFALDAILKANPVTPILEMHQQGKQSIPTLRKERHSGPETHKAPGMLGAPGGMILNYPESAFPRSGLNSRAPQVQAMMSELEKKNQ